MLIHFEKDTRLAHGEKASILGANKKNRGGRKVGVAGHEAASLMSKIINAKISATRYGRNQLAKNSAASLTTPALAATSSMKKKKRHHRAIYRGLMKM